MKPLISDNNRIENNLYLKGFTNGKGAELLILCSEAEFQNKGNQKNLTTHYYCTTNSNVSPSKSPLSLSLREGITSSAINEIDINGA